MRTPHVGGHNIGSSTIDALTGSMQQVRMDPNLPVPILGIPQPLDDLDRAPLANMQSVPSLDPAFVRTSFTIFPRTTTCINRTKIPFGITITPYPSFSTGSDGKPVGYPLPLHIQTPSNSYFQNSNLTTPNFLAVKLLLPPSFHSIFKENITYSSGT